MTKLNLSLGILLIGSAIFAGNFTACSKAATGGTTGTAGTSGGAAGTGAAGMAAAGTSGTAGQDAGTDAAPCTTSMAATKSDGTCVLNSYKQKGCSLCACQTGTPDVCGNSCTDMQTDNANCGTCGNACAATASCNAGVCGAAPSMVLAPITGCTATAGISIATSGTTVYYADAANGVVSAVGAAAPISSAEMGATWIATQGTNVLWYNKTTKAIRMSAGGTAAPTTLYSNTGTGIPNTIGGFVSDGTTLYVSLGITIIKMPVAGGASSVVMTEANLQGQPQALAINGTLGLVSPMLLSGDVDAPKLMPATSPAVCGTPDPNMTDNVIMTDCVRLARSQGELFDSAIFVVAGTAYWVDGPNISSEFVGTAGVPNTGISTASDTVTAFTVSTDTAYFASGIAATTGVIEKAKLTANPSQSPVQVARGQNAPVSIALDATKVYWANSDCSIWSAAK